MSGLSIHDGVHGDSSIPGFGDSTCADNVQIFGRRFGRFMLMFAVLPDFPAAIGAPVVYLDELSSGIR